MKTHKPYFLSVEEYRQSVDSLFVRTIVPAPNRLHPRYFNEDGTQTSVLEQIATQTPLAFKEIRAFDALGGAYATGSQTAQTFTDSSDLDIYIHLNLGRVPTYLEREFRDTIAKQASFGIVEPWEDRKEGRAGKVEFGLYLVKPAGVLYDLFTKEWISFGKTIKDLQDFQLRTDNQF